MSRNGLSRFCGVPPQSLSDWLSRGQAHPEVEPYGSFSREFLAAERGIEYVATSAIAKHLVWIEQQPPGTLVPTDARWLLDVLDRRYPKDHGTGAHRTPEADITGAEWLQKHPLTVDQLRALVRDPPEPLQLALTAELDSVLQAALERGWRPSIATKAKLNND